MCIGQGRAEYSDEKEITETHEKHEKDEYGEGTPLF